MRNDSKSAKNLWGFCLSVVPPRVEHLFDSRKHYESVIKTSKSAIGKITYNWIPVSLSWVGKK